MHRGGGGLLERLDRHLKFTGRRRAQAPAAAPLASSPTATGTGQPATRYLPRRRPCRRPAIGPARAAAAGLKPVTVAVKMLRHGSNVEVLAPVAIHDKKFHFIVDTGASVTVMDSSIAASLCLPAVSKPGTATTVGCTVPVQPVAISAWSIGGQKLPTSVVPPKKPNLAGKTYDGLPIAGLLGADLYYLYGTMT